jgi:serine/threonine protein phosphatase PrpC
VLTNCLGGPEGVKADVDHYLLDDGDIVLLCTDGLNDMVKDEEVADLLDRHPSPPDACDALVALALERGGKDNVTVVVARYSLDDRRSSAGESPCVPS